MTFFLVRPEEDGEYIYPSVVECLEDDADVIDAVKQYTNDSYANVNAERFLVTKISHTYDQVIERGFEAVDS